MKKILLLTFVVLASMAVHAQNSWAMVTIEEGETIPSFSEYHCEPDKGKNGMDYYRIYDEGFRISNAYYNPVKLRYGYRITDKHIYVYDFESEEECLAFDFTLSAGEHFRTYNGMEWEVEAAVDTLVNTSYLGNGAGSMKRLLKVCTTDGRYTDQWLEDFGSFANHFMILPMSDTKQTQTLWMEYEEGHYLVREISSDPLFTHVTAKPENTHELIDKAESVSCIFTDGTLIVEDERSHSPNRQYSCYYRIGDDLYRSYVWNLNPATDAAYVVWSKDVACYTGLPAPQSGHYTIHFRTEDILSGISGPTNDSNSKYASSHINDLQGRRLTKKPTKGVYIQDGKKVVVR